VIRSALSHAVFLIAGSDIDYTQESGRCPARLAWRSRNKASCFRRKTFSAIGAMRVVMNNRINLGNPRFYKNLRDWLPPRPNYYGAQP
jgi:hypothetical protein